MVTSLRLDPLEAVSGRIRATLVPDPPLRIGDGGFILDGVDAELDEFRSIRKDSRTFMARLEASERQATGISTLRIGYNRAARMIERMEAEGVVGPAEGSRPRQVLAGNVEP